MIIVGCHEVIIIIVITIRPIITYLSVYVVADIVDIHDRRRVSWTWKDGIEQAPSLFLFGIGQFPRGCDCRRRPRRRPTTTQFNMCIILWYILLPYSHLWLNTHTTLGASSGFRHIQSRQEYEADAVDGWSCNRRLPADGSQVPLRLNLQVYPST